MIMERKRIDCPALPPGWKKEEVIRKSGLSAGKSDVYYYSPTGKKFRSKPQLSRYLGNTVDLGCFDFRTGKMMPGKLQKNKQRLRSENLSLSKGKPDLNTALPIRQTASIFKQPVTKVVNHPSNKVKTDLQRATEQPRQGAGAESAPSQEESGGGPDGRQPGAGCRLRQRRGGQGGVVAPAGCTELMPHLSVDLMEMMSSVRAGSCRPKHNFHALLKIASTKAFFVVVV
ncbi:methyl-CpG-binding domain protein 2 isoform X2 [Brachyhypopomus gauderio]|uniref:methyl-CpG-binding domain protein 2 isoform X2 n=1 Tax=Brachyhypopomus gauderio TaxID=698409 RepID=UPI0040425B9C